MSSERTQRVATGCLGVIKPWLIVEGCAVRARDLNTGEFMPEQLFAVVVLWDAPTETSAGTWIGWLTTLDHRSACFCAADLWDPGFRQWLADLPGWERSRLALAIETPGTHLVWRMRD